MIQSRFTAHFEVCRELGAVHASHALNSGSSALWPTEGPETRPIHSVHPAAATRRLRLLLGSPRF